MRGSRRSQERGPNDHDRAHDPVGPFTARRSALLVLMGSVLAACGCALGLSDGATFAAATSAWAALLTIFGIALVATATFVEALGASMSAESGPRTTRS